ncbi:MAG TPA: MaoC family dehydratase N-terminal domain-containing protein [Trebonia sp.]|jgi:acyl dehydratase|nr:MaoC family dehydratase N-terminal domain-containing protein [Trebonia sp.]
MIDAVGTEFGDGALREGPDAIEAGAVRRFCEPLELGCPLHHDRAGARGHGYRDVVVPVSGIMTFTIPPLWQPGEPAVFTSPERDAQPARSGLRPRLTGLEPETTGYFAAETAADYLAPATVGDRLARAGNLLVSCVPKETSVGRGAFVTWQYEIRNQRGEAIARVRNTTYSYVPHPQRPPAVRTSNERRPAEREPDPGPQPEDTVPEDMNWDRQRCWEDVTVGQAVPAVRFPLSVYRLVAAAGANRDFNSIHHNSEWARASGAPDMYANVLFLQGMWERCVREFIGTGGLIRQVAGFRMGSFNTVGDVVTVQGSVARVWEEGDAGLAELRVWSRNRHGISVGPGTVTVRVPRRSQAAGRHP